MEQYIPKSALVAEIERKLNLCKTYSTEYVNGKKYALKSILSFLDTLEVKEVDLVKEITRYFKGWGNNEIHCFAMMQDGTSVGVDDCIDIAKHFFELGMQVSNKAQKGE